jgi:hypothetical protein
MPFLGQMDEALADGAQKVSGHRATGVNDHHPLPK